MIKISESEFKFTFSRSSGAGGQNVNKVNTKATLIWNMEHSKAISRDIKERFAKKYARFMVGEEVVIHSQKFRSQNKNSEDCIAKLLKYLAIVEFAQKKRVPTKPSKASNKRRLDSKTRDSQKKKLRREKF